jgi:hypothetical protein
MLTQIGYCFLPQPAYIRLLHLILIKASYTLKQGVPLLEIIPMHQITLL